MCTTVSRKICLLGDFAVGKTSLIRRFVDRQFSDQYLSTVGVKISRKQIEISGVDSLEPQRLQLLIWDLEGSTRFKAVSASYLQGARGAIIVADVSREETLERLPEQIQSYRSVNPAGKIVIALNKSDLFGRERLERLVGFVEDKAQNQVSTICLTSAKTGWNVDQMFEGIAQKLLE